MDTPLEIKLSKDKQTLSVVFAEATYDLPAEFLRVESPSAEVRGHAFAEKKLISGKRDVTITNILPQGNYAVRLMFSDGHQTGIYTWEYLQELGANQQQIWQTYLNNLLDNDLQRSAA